MQIVHPFAGSIQQYAEHITECRTHNRPRSPSARPLPAVPGPALAHRRWLSTAARWWIRGSMAPSACAVTCAGPVSTCAPATDRFPRDAAGILRNCPEINLRMSRGTTAARYTEAVRTLSAKLCLARKTAITLFRMTARRSPEHAHVKFKRHGITKYDHGKVGVHGIQ